VEWLRNTMNIIEEITIGNGKSMIYEFEVVEFEVKGQDHKYNIGFQGSW
jgi:hypothetical protein